MLLKLKFPLSIDDNFYDITFVKYNRYQTVSTLAQNYMFVPAKYKDCHLVYLLNEFSGNTVIIFINTCLNAIK